MIYLEKEVNSAKLRIRDIEESDEPTLIKLFQDGTRQTLSSGLQKLLLQKNRAIPLLSFVASYYLSRRLKSFLVMVLPVAIYALLPYMFGSLMSMLHVAKDADFKQGLYKYYTDKSPEGRKLMLVAELNNKIIGMVGVVPADIATKGHHHGLRQKGDAEMKRMNVCKRYRGYGLSKVLFQVLFDVCKSSGYQRIVLTTSTLQEVACNRLYPNLGFEAMRRVNFLFGAIQGMFFAMPIAEKDKQQ